MGPTPARRRRFCFLFYLFKYYFFINYFSYKKIMREEIVKLNREDSREEAGGSPLADRLAIGPRVRVGHA